MKEIVIFDLDGTIADIEHRRHLVEKPGLFHELSDEEFAAWKPDWDGFFLLCVNDEPKPEVIEICNLLSLKYDIIILSGRSEVVRKETVAWLAKHGIWNYERLWMRPDEDYTPDEVLKLDWLNKLFAEGKKVRMVFDDRDKVVSMWRSQGLQCFQVAEGKF